MHKFPFYPFLLGIYFPLFLFSQNVHRFSVSELWVPLMIVSGIQLIIFGILLLIFRNKFDSAGILVVITLFMFTYGITVKPLEWISIQSFIPGFGPFKFTLMLQGGVFLLLFFWTWKKKVAWQKATAGCNYLSIALLCFVAFTFSSFIFLNSSNTFELSDNNGVIENFGGKKQLSEDSLPDVYHFIMDAYPRADALSSRFGYDNTPFLDELREMGFIINNNAYANYSCTALSLSSSLNSMYLDEFFQSDNIKVDDWKPFKKLIYNSKSAKMLKNIGYKYLVVTNAWESIHSDLVDTYLEPNWSFSSGYLSEYQNGLLALTPIPNFMELADSDMGSVVKQKRKRILYQFEKAKDLSKEKGLKYVYCHIIAPHGPTVFDSKGNSVPDNDHQQLLDENKEKLKDMVIDEIRFLNKKLLETFRTIKENSPRDVVFILQSDHGLPTSKVSDTPDFYKERMGILAAIHLPEDYRDDHSPVPITPINFYPYIANHVFDSKQQLLKPKVFFSKYSSIYNWKNITEILLPEDVAVVQSE